VRLESCILNDRIEFILYGDKSREPIAHLDLYHWRILKELNIDITELLRVAFGGGR